MYSGHFDGASRGNPGEAGAGAVLYNEEGHMVWQKFAYLGSQTNNEAEYGGLLLLLREIQLRGIKKIVIRGDSRLVICQMKKEWKVNSPHLKELWEEAQSLLKGCQATFEWVPRKENSNADLLSNKAIDEHSGKAVLKADLNAVRLERITPTIFIAHGSEDYAVDILHRACTCPAFVNRKQCKHLEAALRKLEQKPSFD
ncbi:ribonuclease H [Aminobacterium colombiense DSM 12261]|uniref:Ribonuclease H n=2 Tax=Aminobacteriaceae TaxID=3029087 RepID=D5EH64_AMICL|nr:ribonuclease H [Aminobacterium colombiense DSM 12261]NLK30404.1 ribonuclease HI family protein [Aminobacterium colombiense]